MSKNKYCCPRQNEDGAALIFALALLALLLIMLIGFLASSLLEQRVPYAFSENNSSRLLARGALVRITGQLENSADDLIWMRNRPADDELIAAPIVSIADDGNLKQAANDNPADNGGDGDAYQMLKPLLRRYFGGSESDKPAPDDIKKDWHWRSFFRDGVNVDYPQWIYYYNNPDKDMITGRVAYVIVPNLGIDPTLPGKGTDPQIGLEYPELNLLAYTTNNGVASLQKYSNWLTLDWMLGKDGLADNKNSNFDFSKIQDDFVRGIGATDSKSAANGNTNEAYKEFASLYFTTNQQISREEDYLGNDRIFFDIATARSFTDYQTLMSDIKLEPAALRNQVAANLRDYMDADSIVTSDLEPDTWLTQTAGTHPTYTGNEKTPYINQIVPSVGLTAEYTFTDTRIPIINNRLISQTVDVNPSVKVFVELINIYPEALPAKSVVLRNFSARINVTASTGTVMNGSKQINQENLTLNHTGTVSPNGYAVLEGEITVNQLQQMLQQTTVMNVGMIGRNAAIPTITVTVQITELKFDRAVLVDENDQNVDYVEGMSVDALPRTVVGSGTEIEWKFSDTETNKHVSIYADFAVEDPRCNLKAAEWKQDWKVSDQALARDVIAGDFALNGKNRDVSAKNDDLTKEMDLEPNDDPAKLTNAYIRNGAMESPWELGLIHRGVKWQTLNLKSAIEPGKTGSDQLTYFNDGMLWDKLKFRDEENGDKFNINYPANMQGAFALLLENLKYHTVTPAMNSYDISEAKNTDTLTGDAEAELRSWIANKCYQANGGKPVDPAASVYPRYISRAQLANVITDWAMHGSESPFRDHLAEIHIEEIIGKIVPLTRCGENYEYFTAFVVAQSVKDIKGTVYQFDGDGNISGKKDGLDHGGKVESLVEDGVTKVYYDKITGTTYLVARLRREIVSCKDTENCRRGLHDKECKFKVTVLESHTLSEP